jgi:hypothetical protein
MNKKIIFIIILILLVVYSIYSFGKKNATGPQGNYPSGGKALPEGWNPNVLADELFDTMSGFDSTSAKEDAWTKLSMLPTGDMVVAVYNVFNQKYWSKDNGTLAQWIRDEGGALIGSSKDAALKVLSQYNLA